MDIIKNADWIIDLGPGAGDKGGKLIATGTPEQVAKVNKSFTGHYIKIVKAVKAKGRGLHSTGRRPFLRPGRRPYTPGITPSLPHLRRSWPWVSLGTRRLLLPPKPQSGRGK